MTGRRPRSITGASWQSELAVAAACAVAGVIVHFASPVFPVEVAAVGLAIGLVGAAFLLAWAADAGEAVFSGGLVLAVIALVAVLPEFVVEVRFAYVQETELVTANLTGATRLLLTGATALPLMVAWIARRRSEAAAPFRLAPTRRVELGMLLITSLFAVQIAARGSVTLIDGVVLVALYILYTRRVQGTPGEEPAVLGVPAGLLTLPPRYRRPAIATLILAAAAVVVTIANPFVDALLVSGASLGMDPYFLIQSVVPAATEMPEFVIVAVLVAHRRPAQGLGLLLASSVSQWTLATGLLPIAYFVGGGQPALPLGVLGQVEVGFLIALTLFAVAALASLRPERVDAALIVGVFAVQFVYPSTVVRLASAFVLLVFAIDLFVDRRGAVRPLLRTLFPRRAAPG